MIKFYEYSHESFYTLDSFQDLLEKYRKDVKKKIYKTRIPYDIWKKLSSITKKDNVRVYFNIADISISGLNLDWEEDYNQNGFAKFLLNEIYNKYKNKGEETKLAETNLHTNTYIDAAKLAGTPLEMCAESATKAINAWDNCISSITSTSNISTWSIIDEEISKLDAKINDFELKLNTKADKVPTENINNDSNKMEDKKMKGFNFDFGSFKNTSAVGLSLYGIAVYSHNREWVSYDPSTGDIINVDLMNIEDGNKYIYKMPVAVKDVKPGDIIIHHSLPVFVNTVQEDGTFIVTDVAANENKCVLPTKSMFGFNFVTKVISLFDFNAVPASSDHPFGNMLPLLMMGEGSKNGSNDMLMAMMMMQNGGMDFSKNPMMMYFLMKDNKDIDPLALMMFSGCLTGGAKA